LRVQTSFCLLSLVLASGCMSPDHGSGPPFEGFTLDDYHPTMVRLSQVIVKATVLDPFPAEYASQRLSPMQPELSFNLEENSFAGHSPRSFWLFKQNESVTLGSYSLESNLHNVSEKAVAIAEPFGATTIHLGGMHFTLSISDDDRARSFFGPFTLASYSLDLAILESGPITRSTVIEHESAFPMINKTNGAIEYVHRNVRMEIQITYFGPTLFHVDEKIIERAKAEPSFMQGALEDYAGDFEPLGRYGQIAPMCQGRVLKSYDPCMNIWEIPIW
jgi:hypothetical protein